MKLRTILFFSMCALGSLALAQRDFSNMGRTPAELRFIEDPLEIELKEPSWFWHDPEEETPEDQLKYANQLLQAGDRDAAYEAYDDLVHEWHATKEALRAQMNLARIADEDGNATKAYEAYIYLLAHFNGRFEVGPVLASAARLADTIAFKDTKRALRRHSYRALRANYERIIHFSPRWYRVPEMLLRIADLYALEGLYSSTITICDQIVVDWRNYEKMDEVVTTYCTACRKLADQWRNDTGQLLQIERLIGGACTFRPKHPEVKLFREWQEEVYVMRRNRSYAKALFYDNQEAYPIESAIQAYEMFLADFPDAKESESARKRLEALKALQPAAPAN